ncbi:MAG: type II toxin-antitoxin system mRNA interferase toxin, RelE/StbE family [Patescibacteria group bacterium]
MRIFLSPLFEKNYKALPRHIQLNLQKKEKIFQINPHHPSLKTHKLSGKMKEFSSFSINRSYRVIFRFVAKNQVIFYDVGTHQIYQ